MNAVAFKVDAIPAELRERPQWVVWRLEERDGKPTKVPYRADGSGRASTTEPASWGSFAAAVAGAETLAADGIGYVFSPDDPFVGVDLDDQLSEADRAAIMVALDSYTEASVSGRGAHVIVRATLNGHGRNRNGPFEVYEKGRYFVLTGDHVRGTPVTIEDRQEQLEAVLARYLPAKAANGVSNFREPRPVDLDDLEVLNLAANASNGADFEALWRGDWNGHGSQSEADLDLCGRLAFWTGADRDRIDRMFRSSGLYRDKWERDDYRMRTIDAAIAGCRNLYSFRQDCARRADEPPAQPNGDGTRLASQPWREFAKATPPTIDWLVRGLIARGAFVFVAAPPKKGKTWLMIDLALAVALGRPFLSRFEVEMPRPVLLVMLEGHRAAVRDRIGAMARGAGVDPDGPELDKLHISYKPAGINLSDPGWAAELRAEAADVKAGLVGVDVLRAAARLKNENSGEDFAILRDNLRPLGDEGRVVALAHHFGKLTELSKERTPGERMTGSGAMYGAMDVGVFITGSDHGARILRLEFDGRDAAMPDPVGVRLLGAGSGENGSLLYTDTARFVTEHAPDPAELKAPPSEIAAWVREQGGEATRGEIRTHFDISDGTLRARRDELTRLGIGYIGTGVHARYIDTGDPTDIAVADLAALRHQPAATSTPHEQAELISQSQPIAVQATAIADLAQPSQNNHIADIALPTGAALALRGTPEPEPQADDDIPF